MNLRESLDNPDHGEGMDYDLPGREDWYWAAAFVNGWGLAKGLDMAASTDGPTIQMHDLTHDTTSPRIRRGGPLRTAKNLRRALIAHLDALEFWEPESDTWGPDPWMDGKDVRREAP